MDPGRDVIEPGEGLDFHSLPLRIPLTDKQLGVACGQKWLEVVRIGAFKGEVVRTRAKGK